MHSWTPQVYEHPNGKGPLVCAESPPNHKQVTAATAAIAVKVKKAKFHVGASCQNCDVLNGLHNGGGGLYNGQLPRQR